ncbi:MAG: beta-N-acetylhexosaminidase [Frankiaceae bacterium]|nr:beta-N-acetylhexosaminidase [Frankiaceae bacterium]
MTATALASVLPLVGGCSERPDSPLLPSPVVADAPACVPAPLPARAAAVLVAGLPETLKPGDPLATSLPRLGVGGILLTQRNVQTDTQVAALTAAIRSRSARPLLVTTDEEGGEVSSFRPVFGRSDSAYAIGTQDPQLLTKRGKFIGTFLRNVGVNGDLAPVADVTRGESSAIGSRSYSSNASTAARDALAVAGGLTDGGVSPTLKHFPGLGRSSDDTHKEVAVIDAPRQELEGTDLAPFVEAIHAGIPTIMVSHAAYPELGITGGPASLSPAAYRLLRQLGFTGVAMTDSLGMGAVNQHFDYPEAGVRALNAGADALLFTDGNQAVRMRDAIVAAVKSGALPESRLDEAAAKVTALGGADPVALTCRDVRLPSLRPTAPGN